MFWFPFVVLAIMLSASGFGEVEGAIASLAGFDGAKTTVVRMVLGQVTFAILYVAGFAIALLRKDGRALHDLVARSRVRAKH